METFIVLGLCFILYEALDLFQSCYNRPNQHQPLQNVLKKKNKIKSNNNNNQTAVDSKDTTRLILDVIPEIGDSGGGGAEDDGDDFCSDSTDSDGSSNDDSSMIIATVHLSTAATKVFSISDTVECCPTGLQVKNC